MGRRDKSLHTSRVGIGNHGQAGGLAVGRKRASLLEVSRRKRASYGREGLQTHDENRAAKLLRAGLNRLGLTSKTVVGLKQSDPRNFAHMHGLTPFRKSLFCRKHLRLIRL